MPTKHTKNKAKIKTIGRDIKITPPKKTQKPQTYAEKAEFLRHKMHVSNAIIGTRNKQKFTPQQKKRITQLFDGKKVVSPEIKRKLADGQYLIERKKFTYHTGGLWQYRDAHKITIKNELQREKLDRYKVVGDMAYIPKKQKNDRLRVLKDGTTVRRSGEMEFRSIPLTRQDIIDIMDDPVGWAERQDEKYPGVEWRIEYGSSYSNRYDNAELLAHYISNMNQQARDHITSLSIIQTKKRKRKHGKKTKTRRHSRLRN